MRLVLLSEGFFEGQTWSGSDGVEYSVPRLMAWAKLIVPLRPLEVAEFAGDFEEGRHWSDEPDFSPEFVNRANSTDLSYPVLIGIGDGDHVIIDGRHRIFKALQSGRPTLPAYIVKISDLPEEALA